MKKKEILVLDCGVDIREEERGVVFTSFDSGREFAFCLHDGEVADMIVYLRGYMEKKSIIPAVEAASMPKREMTPIEKAAQAGVQAMNLASSATASGRVVPAHAVSIHKG